MPRLIRILTFLAAALALPQFALAHAVLIHSTPKQGQVVQGATLNVDLKFNSRIDGPRCTLSLASSDGVVRKLQLATQPARDEIASKVEGLHRGKYTLRWQALSVDGHITRGEIPFQVK